MPFKYLFMKNCELCYSQLLLKKETCFDVDEANGKIIFQEYLYV